MNQLLILLSQCLNTSKSELDINAKSEDFDNWDSITVINLAISLESEYGIAFTAEDVAQLNSVKSIIDVLERHNIAITR